MKMKVEKEGWHRAKLCGFRGSAFPKPQSFALRQPGYFLYVTFGGVFMGLRPTQWDENPPLVTPAQAGVHVGAKGGFPLSRE